MRPAADDVAQILANETALTLGTDLFIGFEPDTPNGTLVIYDTGGGQPDLPGFRQPTVQLRSRDPNYVTAWDRINNAVQALHASKPRTVNGTYNSSWFLQSDIIFLERDDKDRAIFTANMRGHRQE